MRVEGWVGQSAVARRILWLFLLCALVPLGLAVVLSLRVVEREVARLAEDQLRVQVKELAFQVWDRLSMAESWLRVFGQAATKAGTVEDNGQPWLSSVVEPGATTSAEEAAAPRGPILDLSRLPSVWLAVDSGHGVRLGELNVERLLWGARGGNSLPPGIGLAVLGDRGELVFATSEADLQWLPPSWLASPQTTGGGVISVAGEERVGRFWRLPLRGFRDSAGATTHLRFVAYTRTGSTLGLSKRLVRSLWLAAAVAVLLVGLLSMIQIRRTLVPLQELRSAARRIANGELGAEAPVAGADEFGELAVAFNEMSLQVRRQFQTLETASEIDRAILSSLDPTTILQIALTRLDEVTGARAAAIVLRSERGDRAIAHRWRSGVDTVESLELPIEPFGELDRPRQLHVIEEDPPRWLEALPKPWPERVLVAPVRHGEGVRGALIAGVEEPVPNETEAALAAIADQLAIAIENANLVTRLDALHQGVLVTLARTVDLKSSWTRGHSERVAEAARRMADAAGLSGGDADILYRAGLVHDLGKIAVPDAILNKPTSLTSDELLIVQEHVRLGAEVLEGVPGYGQVARVVWQHHERWDGTGYPRQLRGEEIDPLARILAVADVFDALRSERPYRPGLSAEAAAGYLRQSAGSHFEPAAVELFLELFESSAGAARRET